MKQQPAVSIYVITYLNSEERGRILKATCENLLEQRYPNFEVVVSDNAGTFSAIEALSSIEDPRLTVHENKENVGFAGNMDRCLEHCSHDIIKPMCDDDLIHPDFLAATVPLVDDKTLVMTGYEKYSIGTEPEALAREIDSNLALTHRESGYGHDIWRIPYSSSSIPSATIFTRALFRRLGGFDGNSVTSDYDFFVEACVHGKTVFVAQTFCWMGIWGGSLTETLVENPYFFPFEALYTRFRVLHCKTLSATERSSLKRFLLVELVRQGSRVIRRFYKREYWNGYASYARRFLALSKPGMGMFADRPNQ